MYTTLMPTNYVATAPIQSNGGGNYRVEMGDTCTYGRALLLALASFRRYWRYTAAPGPATRSS